MRTSVRTVLFSLLSCSAAWPVETTPARPTAPRALYDSNPDHLWNRIHHILFVATGHDGTEYGFDNAVFRGNPLLFQADDDRKAGALLDELGTEKGANLIRDPIKRAILQHDLWTLFDGFTRWWKPVPDTKERIRALQTRLARSIRKLALSAEQIRNLPDNYSLALRSHAFAANYDPDHRERPFLPQDLFDPNGSWIQIEPSSGDEITGRMHAEAVSGRSVFEIFIRLPDGRDETLAYLKKLNLFETPWQSPLSIATVSSTGEKERWGPQLDPNTPQFPAGTMVALVRRMILVSDEVEPIASPLVQSIQLRVYRQIGPWADSREEAEGRQDFYEFELRRAALFANQAGGLRAIEKGERELQLLFRTARETEQEEFGGHVVLETCITCHQSPGIFSVNSYNRFTGRQIVNPQLLPTHNPGDVRRQAVDWKRRQFDWGFLDALLASQTK
jgi:hypothetical protein